MINTQACTNLHASRGKCPIDDYSRQPQRYSQWYLTLPIPGSRLNARNAPGTHPYCNRQSSKNFMDWTNSRNLTPRYIFNVKIFPIYYDYRPYMWQSHMYKKNNWILFHRIFCLHHHISWQVLYRRNFVKGRVYTVALCRHTCIYKVCRSPTLTKINSEIQMFT